LKIKLAFAFASTVVTFGSPTLADHWMQTADPVVVQALNEVAQVYGYYCNQGDQNACQLANNVYQSGTAMLMAGYDCQMQGMQDACQYYNAAFGELSMVYGQITQTMPQQQYQDVLSGGNVLGATHDERMGNIAAWGQERIEWGITQSGIADANHDAFIAQIRGD
jgi:hypothetical protein